MALDIQESYGKAKEQITSAQSYKDLKDQYNSLQKEYGNSFEESRDELNEQFNTLKEKSQAYQKELKNQFDQLLDIKKVLGGKNSNTIKYIKRILIKSLTKIEPKIANIINNEVLSLLGCDQQQAYAGGGSGGQVMYIKVKSIDLAGLLIKDPVEKKNKPLYEKQQLSASQLYPYPMNKQLYNRIQSDDPYTTDTGGSMYLGRSGKPLFDIQYTEFNPLTNKNGEFYKVTLQDRITLGRLNNVNEFIQDYYKTIKIVDFTSMLSWILECSLGAISIKGGIGLKKVEDVSKGMAVLQRILGICFDNRKTINVSGISKLSETDDTDNSFFELSPIDLRRIQDRVDNIRNGVAKFVTCNNVALPINVDGIFDDLDEITFIEDPDKEAAAADAILKKVVNDPDWNGFTIDGGLELELDLGFIKNMIKGIAFSLLSPKVLLPLAIMLKALGRAILDAVDSFYDFMRRFSEFFKNVVSKIAAIFIQTLFNDIKKDVRNLIQSIILDLAKEKSAKQVQLILKLVQLLITVGQFIRDWRECRSVVDELLWLLRIATSGWGTNRNPITSSKNSLPLPLVFAAQLLDGYSQTRTFINTIQQLQKIGVPTGPMPDGTPNLTVLSMYSSIKAYSDEMSNTKVQVAVPPLTMTPAGFTIPSNAFGVLI